MVETFNSLVTGKMYKVKATTICRISNVVYAIECNRCSKEYEGETKNALDVRMSGHWSNINHRHLEKPVAQHFNSNGHSLEDLSFFIIKKIHKDEATFHKVEKANGFGLSVHWPKGTQS